MSNVEEANWWWGNDPAWSAIGAKTNTDWDAYHTELSKYYKGQRSSKPKTPPSWKENGPGEAYEGITPTKVTDAYNKDNYQNPFCSSVTTTNDDGSSDGPQEPVEWKGKSGGAGKPGGSAGSNGKGANNSANDKESSRSGAARKSTKTKSRHRRSSYRRFSK